MRLWHGGIVNSSIPISSKTNLGKNVGGTTSICLAQIREVVYSDDDNNILGESGNKQVMYNCEVIGGPDAGRLFYSCVMARPYAGSTNFQETVLTPNTDKENQQNSKGARKLPSQNSGDLVIVARLFGYSNFPVIIGSLPSYKVPTAAKKSDGVRQFSVTNGIVEKVTAQGNKIIRTAGSAVDSVKGVMDISFKVPSLSEVVAQLREEAEEMLGCTGFSLTPGGAISLSNKIGNKIGIDRMGQLGLKSPLGGIKMLTGGITKMQSTVTDIKSTAAMNIKSTLTSIGQGGVPAARISDMSLGTDSNGMPVVSRVMSGSFISLVGS